MKRINLIAIFMLFYAGIDAVFYHISRISGRPDGVLAFFTVVFLLFGIILWEEE